MNNGLIKNNNEKDKKLYVFLILSILFIIVLTRIKNPYTSEVYITNFGVALKFIKLFNCILAMLALGSCILSYNRVKKENVFIISLIYMILFLDILWNQLDYLNFYVDDVNLSTYMTISTSVMRGILLVISFYDDSKLKKFIITNKIVVIIGLIIYTPVFGYIEKYIFSNVDFNRNTLFYLYNALIALVYFIGVIKLFLLGIKQKDRFQVVLGLSFLAMSIREIYAIYGFERMNFNVKMICIGITYISFIIVIFGAFIELYFCINQVELTNKKFQILYNVVENNKHSFMVICDENLDIIYANKKVRDYYSKSKDIELNELQMKIKQKISSFDQLEKVLQTPLEELDKLRGIAYNEENRAFDYSVQLISLTDNEEGIAILYTDISDEISMQIEIEKLKAYDKERSEFIFTVSHELRTPLNIFYSTIQLLDFMSLNHDVDFKDTYYKYKKALHINCKRMLRLINNVIDSNKIEEGILKVNFKNYNIVSLVEDVTLSVVNYSVLKSIDIIFDTNEEEHIIKCDASMIERAMLNLLSNAIKFTDENKHIYVNVNVKEECVEIEVIDEGIGIPQEAQKKIFRKFAQSDKSLTRRNEGSGIGLSIVQSIVDVHKGRIELESDINKGSTFRIILPNELEASDDINLFEVDVKNTELELSDIYEVL